MVLGAVLAAPGAAAIASPQVGAALTYQSCRGIKDAGPTGADPADVKGLRKRRVSCPRARRVARQWLKPFGNRHPADGSVRFGRWICFDGIGKVNGVNRTRVACKARGGQRVRFYLG
ncbi:MAG: hypothetical protein M3433_02815 [Actinomycetota bacterium]|nr:hypothetical protein [Actinomycetota bacterium]